jgi:hypothetical protein
MTEEEWLGHDDPDQMIEFAWKAAGERKSRMFALACCHRVFLLMNDPRAFRAIEVAERAAEGQADEAEIEPARMANFDLYFEVKPDEYWDLKADYSQAANVAQAVNHLWSGEAAEDAARFAATATAYDAGPYESPTWEAAYQAERRIQSDILRDIFGNPFCPVSLNPSWQTPTVSSLAHAAYDNRLLPSGELEAARLAILADALEDAGCPEAAILDHLRSAGPHVRGCWCVDLCLGRW